jgi:hypothetical protein
MRLCGPWRWLGAVVRLLALGPPVGGGKEKETTTTRQQRVGFWRSAPNLRFGEKKGPRPTGLRCAAAGLDTHVRCLALGPQPAVGGKRNHNTHHPSSACAVRSAVAQMGCYWRSDPHLRCGEEEKPTPDWPALRCGRPVLRLCGSSASGPPLASALKGGGLAGGLLPCPSAQSVRRAPNYRPLASALAGGGLGAGASMPSLTVHPLAAGVHALRSGDIGPSLTIHPGARVRQLTR